MKSFLEERGIQVNVYIPNRLNEGYGLNKTAMEEIAKQLSRHFNVNIQLQGKEIFDYTYSATFTTETLAEILSLLEKTAPIRCEIIEPQQQNDLAFTRKKVIIRKR